MKLETRNLSFSYGSRTVLTNIHLQALPGKITALIGPNAAGKSTLLKVLSGILKAEGEILLDDKEITAYKKEEFHKFTSYLPQEFTTRPVLTVFEAVLLGRLHSLSWIVSENDLTAAMNVLEDIGISELALRYLNELSGGQRQIVYIAQALTREPDILLMDEPTNNLDLKHQLMVIEMIKRLTGKKKLTTIIALHDINIASRYVDTFIVLNHGEVHACGDAVSVLTPEMFKSVYGVEAKVKIDEGTLHIFPVASLHDLQQ